MSITVLVDCLFIVPGKNRGTQTYTDSLLRELSQDRSVELICLTNKVNHEYYSNDLGLNCVRMPVSGVNRVVRLCFQQFFLWMACIFLKGDLLFCPGYLSPVFATIPVVPVIHDMNYKDIPYSVSRLNRILYTLLVPLEVRRSSMVITISEFSKERLTSLLKLDESRVRVVWEGPLEISETLIPQDWLVIQEKYQISRPVILSISSGAKHKNIDMLVRAFTDFNVSTGGQFQLVLIGHANIESSCPEVLDTLRAGDIVVTGYISESEKLSFLLNSFAYVFPSLYEGFGLPVLEAQSCGLPLICSTSASLPEVAGDGAYYFDPNSCEELISALREVTSDRELRTTLITRGRSNVLKFSWKSCALNSAKVFREVLKSRSTCVGDL